jgi:hypothetical protein
MNSFPKLSSVRPQILMTGLVLFVQLNFWSLEKRQEKYKQRATNLGRKKRN